MAESQSADTCEHEDAGMASLEFMANGVSMKTSEVEAKLDEGNIEDAELLLREGLSLNSEEARALLGRLEYQRGHFEGAFWLFDGTDLQAAIERLQPSLSEKASSKKGRARLESVPVVSRHPASLLLESAYLKAKSLQKLGRVEEAIQECKTILDTLERIFHQALPDVQVDNRLQETANRALELFPELWRQAGCHQEAVAAYRRALLGSWNIDNDYCARIQKQFAIFLLYNGVETGPPCLSTLADGSYIPKNSLEESILLMMSLLRKFHIGSIKWDPSLIEHLTFAISLCSQTSVLAKQLEAIMPGVLHRVERWNTLALCFTGIGKSRTALNLLRMSLHKHEEPNDLMALLLASKICSEDSQLSGEGVEYAQRAVSNAVGKDEHFKGVGLRMMGVCYGKQAKISSSDFQRSDLQFKALKSLEGAVPFQHNNLDLIYELGIHYAEQRNLDSAFRCAKKFLDATDGSSLKAWRLLALVYSAQHRFSEAEVVVDTAMDDTAKWDQVPLLRLKAKLKVAQSLPMEAIETYRSLLALVQAQRKSFGPFRSATQVEDNTYNEFEVWDGLANLYSSLSHWNDAEICLGKARELYHHSPMLHHTEGLLYERQGENQKALASYIVALLGDPSYLHCKILLAAQLLKIGSTALPVARTLLTDALRIEPHNRMAWFYMGMLYKCDGRLADACECFQAASVLEESDPIESFSSIA